MRIAVTGASGFIGSELLELLKRRDDTELVALTRDIINQNRNAECEWRMTDYSYESLTRVIKDVEVVIHLAGVRGTESDSDKFVVNERMTENLLNAMSATGAKRIVFASTVSVYNDEKMIPWREEDPLQGRTAYGESKIRCEEMIREYAKRYGFTYGIARIAQVLGTGEKRRGMLSVFLENAAAKSTLKVMGKSVVAKQYIYVEDLVNVLGLLAYGEKHFSDMQNITVNVGMQNAYTNLEVARFVNKAFGNETPIDYDDSYPETGRAFCMDTGKLRNDLNYIPRDMEGALRDIAGQHRNDDV